MKSEQLEHRQDSLYAEYSEKLMSECYSLMSSRQSLRDASNSPEAYIFEAVTNAIQRTRRHYIDLFFPNPSFDAGHRIDSILNGANFESILDDLKQTMMFFHDKPALQAVLPCVIFGRLTATASSDYHPLSDKNTKEYSLSIKNRFFSIHPRNYQFASIKDKQRLDAKCCSDFYYVDIFLNLLSSLSKSEDVTINNTLCLAFFNSRTQLLDAYFNADQFESFYSAFVISKFDNESACFKDVHKEFVGGLPFNRYFFRLQPLSLTTLEEKREMYTREFENAISESELLAMRHIRNYSKHIEIRHSYFIKWRGKYRAILRKESPCCRELNLYLLKCSKYIREQEGELAYIDFFSLRERVINRIRQLYIDANGDLVSEALKRATKEMNLADLGNFDIDTHLD